MPANTVEAKRGLRYEVYSLIVEDIFSLLNRELKKLKLDTSYWVSSKNNNVYCNKCTTRQLIIKDWLIESPKKPSDRSLFCFKCRKLLPYTLNQGCSRTELNSLYKKGFVRCPEDCYRLINALEWINLNNILNLREIVELIRLDVDINSLIIEWEAINDLAGI